MKKFKPESGDGDAGAGVLRRGVRPRADVEGGEGPGGPEVPRSRVPPTHHGHALRQVRGADGSVGLRATAVLPRLVPRDRWSASAAVAVRIANTSGPDAQASAGMYAFGDGLLFIAVFSAVAIFPTGLALCFLRPCRWFWVGALGNGAGDRRHGDPGGIGLRRGGLPGAPPRIPLDGLGGSGGPADARSASPGCRLRARRGHRPQPDVTMGAARGGRDRGCGGCVRRPPLVPTTVWGRRRVFLAGRPRGLCW